MMLSLFAKSVAILASVRAAAGLAVPTTESKAMDVTKRATGSVNAAYFVNW